MARITPETAREMAAKSHEARRQRAEAARNVLPLPQTPSQLAEADLRDIACARAHVDKLDALVTAARDPLDLDRLMRALGAAREQLRILLGRPLPGQLRPKTAPRATSADVEPL